MLNFWTVIMKKLMALLAVFCSCHCLAEDSIWQTSLSWIADTLPAETNFDYDSTAIKFQGCKQRSYAMHLNQPINTHFSVDVGLGYNKGELQWGVFSQKVSMTEWSMMPRYALSEKISVGLGVVSQSSVNFKSTQGQAFDLPNNREWLANTRVFTDTAGHFWDITVSSQKWQASNATGTWFERGEANNKVSLSYTGFF
jgi:hypothetical protein